jgi:hypothetical protein
MSKLIALVAFSVLISLTVIAGRSTDASGRFARAFGAQNANAHLSAAVKSLVFLNGQGSPAADMFSQFEGDRPHGCHSDSYYDPADD